MGLGRVLKSAQIFGWSASPLVCIPFTTCTSFPECNATCVSVTGAVSQGRILPSASRRGPGWPLRVLRRTPAERCRYERRGTGRGPRAADRCAAAPLAEAVSPARAVPTFRHRGEANPSVPLRGAARSPQHARSPASGRGGSRS